MTGVLVLVVLLVSAGMGISTSEYLVMLYGEAPGACVLILMFAFMWDIWRGFGKL